MDARCDADPTRATRPLTDERALPPQPDPVPIVIATLKVRQVGGRWFFKQSAVILCDGRPSGWNRVLWRASLKVVAGDFNAPAKSLFRSICNFRADRSGRAFFIFNQIVQDNIR